MIALAVLILVASAAEVPCPHPARSQAVVQQFKATHPCPKTCALYIRDGSRFVLYSRCGACQVDHVCPLACCGEDSVENLQWLTAKENREKGADCTKCPISPPAAGN